MLKTKNKNSYTPRDCASFCFSYDKSLRRKKVTTALIVKALKVLNTLLIKYVIEKNIVYYPYQGLGPIKLRSVNTKNFHRYKRNYFTGANLNCYRALYEASNYNLYTVRYPPIHGYTYTPSYAVRSTIYDYVKNSGNNKLRVL